ncbi:MAG: metalloregulator ArsR/SmtB family transcription factor [Thermoflexibacter sp.]|jgi:ArsR family transcriptional regulator|nr:metalloregulator ArsR/SmtB family transcription factor [Thermoflexibacter sp.]
METQTLHNKEKLEKAAFILKTVAHPTRLAIIDLLHQKPMSVSELSRIIDCEQSLLSHHLMNMKLRGILSSQKEGQNVYYALKEKDVVKLIACIEHCNCNM